MQTNLAYQGPLAGVRVLDLSSVIFGPMSSQVLADYGAEVIKIEPPSGDSTRHTGPAVEKGMAAMFLGSNRSKKSVMLDLKQLNAQEALQALIPQQLISFDDAVKETLRREDEVVDSADWGYDPEARARWRSLVRENHPDRAIAAGLPREAIRLAEARTRALNADAPGTAAGH